MRFRLLGILLHCTLLSTVVHGKLVFDWVTVGNAGNGADVTGHGAVDYTYRISKHEVTNGQYTEYLNSIDPQGIDRGLAQIDTFAYDPRMESKANGGIRFDRNATEGSRYQVKPGQANKPVAFVSFVDAQRFTNWLHNGQAHSSSWTGAYDSLGSNTIERNRGATYFIPTEDEWYKAAYHKNDGVTANYWSYPTSSNDLPFSAKPPGDAAPTPSNTMNVFSNNNLADGYNDGYAVTGSRGLNSLQNYLTDVGSYVTSPSPYGTFDQGGNVYEWYESSMFGLRGMRGGSWNDEFGPFHASASYASVGDTHGGYEEVGFRIASIVPQAEPGDFNADGVLDATDLDLLADAQSTNDPAFDLNGNHVTDFEDRIVWLTSIRHTYVGDSNFDGEFNSGDFVEVFGVGKFENGARAGWAEGDWDGNRLFDSSDFVAAFQQVGYEQGPRLAISSVPEPHLIGELLVIVGPLSVHRLRRSHRRLASLV